jgi:hypothetical protein
MVRPMTKDELFARLIENALDFLNRAIEEFKTHPKYSIIHFYAAAELFLKARLLHEHWSLVVLKDPDRQKFEAGDFLSVPFAVACERLHKVAQSAVPGSTRKNLANEPRLDHAWHVSSWLKVLKEDRKGLFTAADKSSTYLAFITGGTGGQ